MLGKLGLFSDTYSYTEKHIHRDADMGTYIFPLIGTRKIIPNFPNIVKKPI